MTDQFIMDFNQISNTIEEASRILLLTSLGSSYDNNIACIVFSSAIAERYKAKSNFSRINSDEYYQFEYIKPLEKKIKIIKDDLPQDFVIEVANESNKLQNIEWKKEEKSIKFHITCKDNLAISKEDVKLSSKAIDFDLVVLIGAKSLEELGSVYANHKELFTNTKILHISKDEDTKIKTDFEIKDTKASSYSEIIYEILQELKINISSDDASSLLLGLYAGTNGFAHIVNPKTFNIAANLVALKADTESVSKDYKSLNLEVVNIKSTQTDNTNNNRTDAKKVDQPIQNIAVITPITENKQDIIVGKKVEVKKPVIENTLATTISEDIDDSKLQIPLQRAKSIPQKSVPSNNEPINFGTPNFVAPPPINPVKQNNFNLPLSPKLR